MAIDGKEAKCGNNKNEKRFHVDSVYFKCNTTTENGGNLRSSPSELIFAPLKDVGLIFPGSSKLL
jgi:hypothetical protein